MSWIAVAVGGSALVGAGASYLGSKKQAQGAKDAAGINMQQYQQLRSDQMPYTQAGYGALGRLNTLLGIGGGRAANQGSYRPPGNMQSMPVKQNPMAYGVGGQGTGGIAQSQKLRNLLVLRAMNGDTQAEKMLSKLG